MLTIKRGSSAFYHIRNTSKNTSVVVEFEGSGHIPLTLVGMLITNPTYLPPELGIRWPLQFALPVVTQFLIR